MHSGSGGSGSRPGGGGGRDGRCSCGARCRARGNGHADLCEDCAHVVLLERADVAALGRFALGALGVAYYRTRRERAEHVLNAIEGKAAELDLIAPGAAGRRGAAGVAGRCTSCRGEAEPGFTVCEGCAYAAAGGGARG